MLFTLFASYELLKELPLSNLHPEGTIFFVTNDVAHHKHGEDEESVGDEQTLMCSWLAGVLMSWEWFAQMLTVGTWESWLGC